MIARQDRLDEARSIIQALLDEIPDILQDGIAWENQFKGMLLDTESEVEDVAGNSSRAFQLKKESIPFFELDATDHWAIQHAAVLKMQLGEMYLFEGEHVLARRVIDESLLTLHTLHIHCRTSFCESMIAVVEAAGGDGAAALHHARLAQEAANDSLIDAELIVHYLQSAVDKLKSSKAQKLNLKHAIEIDSISHALSRQVD